MDRSGAAPAFRAFVALLPGVLLLGGIGTLRALPAVQLDHTGGPSWLPLALASALVACASVASLLALVDGLRNRRLSDIADAGAAASLAGGAVGTMAGAAISAMALPVFGAALFVAAAIGLRSGRPLRSTGTTRLAAVAALLLAETFGVAGLLPPVSELVAPTAPIVFAAAALIALGAALALPRRAVMAVSLATGALGLLADRDGSLESILGLAALAVAMLVAISARLAADAEPEPATAEERLPALAARLADPVLRFDGHLRLREWNRPAAELLGLDAASLGARAEDLLGVSLADLGPEETSVVSRGTSGGLEIAMHRSVGGITAVVRDPGAPLEADRLGQELRTTLEELLRARRTIDLQRNELERSATVDPITGISSRGAILERLRVEVAQARRYRHPLAVALIDIDGFSAVNQRLGHAAGDAVLREIALRFRLRVRDADAIGRIGSDAFVAAMPHTDEVGAATFADALRHRLGARAINVGDEMLPVTVSVGVAVMRPGEDLEIDSLMARAEEALESARAAGGNRIALDRLHGLARLEDPHDSDATG